MNFMECDDCGGPIGKDGGPPDGWQLEDGRTVCQACCALDTSAFVDLIIYTGKHPEVLELMKE